MISGVSKPVPAMSVTDAQREVLESLARSQSGPHREVVRAKALLMAADGASNATIAARLSVSRSTVANWRTRFTEDGLVKFGQVREGRGRKSSIPDATIEKIVTLTKEYRPEGETHWSTRTMAGVAGVSKSTVQRVWKELGLKPHRVDTFKVSGDPKFEEKLVDVVGLDLNPPENAIVLCADEKSSVQALDRTQASLPMTKGRGQTMTHDYKRNGTTTLFAALNVLTGHGDRAMPTATPPPGVSQIPAHHRPRGSQGSPTSTPTCDSGLTSTPASTCTSPQPPRRGSTRWNAGSAS